MTTTLADVHPVHQAELDGSCIAPDRIIARGYRTLVGSDEDLRVLKDLRVPRWAWRDETAFPGLLIPMYRVTGEEIGCQFKPSIPQEAPGGKKEKYASQAGVPNRLDVPPLSADLVRDPSAPLWITEGVKKGDCLSSRGKAVITLTGVFNWRSKLGTLGDWEDVPLKGRTVVVCFDADARDKRSVMLAMRRLGKWLESKGAADIRYLIVPPEVNGVSVKGVDDYFCAGGTLEDLGSHALKELPTDGAKDASFSDAVLTDTLCSEELDGRFKWSAGLGWMEWSGKVWSPATDASVTEAVRLWALNQFNLIIDRQKLDPNRDMDSQISGWRSVLSSSRMRALVGLARGVLECHATDFDADPDLLNCPNGILDLRTGHLEPHDPDRFMTKIAGVDYVKGAQHPDWDTALRALPDELLGWFQARIGQSITGHMTPDDVVVISQGGGENGKSTVFDAITAAAGQYYTVVADRAMLGNGSDNHPTEMMDFMGARLAVLEETPEERRLDTNRLKKLSGTNQISARKIRQDSVTFSATHTLFVNTNHRPDVFETDHGTWRRLLLLVWPFTFQKDPKLVKGPYDRLGDPTLRQRVKENVQVREAVLAWMVAGARHWYEADRILPQHPDRVAADTLTWRKVSDMILSYIGDMIQFDPDSHVLSTELRKSFNDYIKEKGGQEWGDKTFVGRFGGHQECSQHKVEKKKIKAREGLSRLNGFGSVPPSYAAWLGIRFKDLNKEDQVDGGDEDQVPAVPAESITQLSATYGSVNFSAGTAGTVEDSTKVDGGTMDPFGPENSTQGDHVTGVLGFDLETGSADQMFTYGDGFIRLCGMIEDDGTKVLTTDPGAVVAALEAAPEVYGHNILGFDGLALAYHHGLDWEDFAAKAVDTELNARLADPPHSREKGSIDKYDLDHVAEKLGLEGKTDSLPALARKHGGYDKIPQDDPQYRSYLEGDLAATQAVRRKLPTSPYGQREHQLASLAGRMTLNGFRVDVPLLHERIEEGKRVKAAALKELNETYGIPLNGKSPLASNAGKEALIRALGECGIPKDPSGVPYHPKTPKSGSIAAGRDGMALINEHYGDLPGISRLCELVTTVTTVRTVYQTAEKFLIGDRVHPGVSMRQASGRWSVTNPGLTVYGKHAGRHHERDIFIGEPGHVILTCDLSQVDMRAIAGHCQDAAYMALFAPGRDAHQEIADMLGIKRQDAKARGHGWNYGLGAKRMIAEGADEEVVWKFIRGMESRFPTLMAWREEIRDRGGRGELLDNGFGRFMRCDPRAAYTVAPALMGQGGARDIMCESLLKLPDWMRPYLRTMVHDEVVLSVPEHLADVVGRTVKEAFTWEWRGVPILCDLSKPGHSWGDVSEK